MSFDTAPVRHGEELDRERLSDYLKGKLEGAEDGVTIQQFPGGHSNLTYMLRAGEREYVLRRAPLGPVAPKAHDMAREYAVLKAVQPFFAPAPHVFHLCEDPAVIGAVFFVMERRRGIILRERLPPELENVPRFRERVSQGFTDCLVQLHSIDLERNGLLGLGKPAGFLERQVRGWAERWGRCKTENLAPMENLIRWLSERMPVSQGPTLVHNDFKLDNVMIDSADPGRIEAVLDWEMAAIGDPLVDLGLTLCYWAQPTHLGPVGSITSGPGWYTRDEMVQRYATKTGFDVSNISYYEVFAVFKLAVVLQQIYYRFHCGQTQDERFRNFDQRVRNLVETGHALASGDVSHG